jgi:hypothetical protein
MELRAVRTQRTTIVVWAFIVRRQFRTRRCRVHMWGQRSIRRARHIDIIGRQIDRHPRRIRRHNLLSYARHRARVRSREARASRSLHTVAGAAPRLVRAAGVNGRIGMDRASSAAVDFSNYARIAELSRSSRIRVITRRRKRPSDRRGAVPVLASWWFAH